MRKIIKFYNRSNANVSVFPGDIETIQEMVLHMKFYGMFPNDVNITYTNAASEEFQLVIDEGTEWKQIQLGRPNKFI